MKECKHCHQSIEEREMPPLLWGGSRLQWVHPVVSDSGKTFYFRTCVKTTIAEPID